MTLSNCLKCNSPFDSYSKWGIKKYCSPSCANGRTKSELAKNQLSEKMQGINSYTKIKFCQCEICQITFMWNSVSKGSARHCNSESCFIQFKYNVRCGKVGGFKPNSTRVHRSIYNGQQMDSGAELQFAKLLDLHNIKWIKNSTQYFEYLPGKKYYPDFYLKDYDLWIEIKGKRYYRLDDPLRWASVPNHEVIWSNNLTLPLTIGGPKE